MNNTLPSTRPPLAPSVTLDCTASLVAYRNDPDTLQATATSFLRTTATRALYIVDNAAGGPSAPVFRTLPVTYVKSPRNVGYGRGHNLALRHVPPSRYHLILNPDVTVPEGVIEELIAFMDANPAVGMVCPTVRNTDGSVQYLQKRQTTVLDLFLRRAVPGRLRGLVRRRMEWHEMRDVDRTRPFDVPYMSGCFMLCRRQVLDRIGGFDPRYFLHFEDADLTRKFHDVGARTVCYPHCSVTHAWARAPHTSLRAALVLMRNGVRYFNKWGWQFA
jgi:GT2 family glycosyltransferase